MKKLNIRKNILDIFQGKNFNIDNLVIELD